jgi:hypothetical protein
MVDRWPGLGSSILSPKGWRGALGHLVLWDTDPFLPLVVKEDICVEREGRSHSICS